MTAEEVKAIRKIQEAINEFCRINETCQTCYCEDCPNNELCDAIMEASAMIEYYFCKEGLS